MPEYRAEKVLRLAAEKVAREEVAKAVVSRTALDAAIAGQAATIAAVQTQVNQNAQAITVLDAKVEATEDKP